MLLESSQLSSLKHKQDTKTEEQNTVVSVCFLVKEPMIKVETLVEETSLLICGLG